MKRANKRGFCIQIRQQKADLQLINLLHQKIAA